MSGHTPYALVGSRTTAKRDGNGRGVGVFRTDTAPWVLVDTWEATNPTFLVSGHARQIYAVHGDGSETSWLTLSAMGHLTRAGSRDTTGTNPVHLCLDGRWLLVVNHSGSVVSLPVDPSTGALGEVAGRIDLDGEPGPHRTDQPGPKPHQVVQIPGTDLFLVPDKGLDTVFTLRLNRAKGALTEASRVRVREGAGPRHLVIHPRARTAYTIDELASTVTGLRMDRDGRLAPFEVHSTLDPKDVRDSRGAEIAIGPDGRMIYASNRSGAGDHTPGGPDDDTVARFEVGDNGSLTPAGWLRTRGIRPRHVVVDGDDLIVANERSHNVVSVPTRGTSPARQLCETGSPVCVLLLP